MRRDFRLANVIPAAAIMLASASCGNSGTEPTATDIRNYITSLTTSNGAISASFREGQPPAPGSGPAVTANGTSSMILGGGALRSLTSTTAFSRIIVAVTGVSGYWELTLSSAVTAQDIILSLAQAVPATSFTVQYAGGTSAAIGAFDAEAVAIIAVGTGDVQVSVSWDAESDVDLHVVEPGGAEIYYGVDLSASGGTLDLDSNPGCSIDGKKNENITWPTQTPPTGTYIVRVDYFDSCGVSATNYVVTVRVKGQSPKTFTGKFTGLGDAGAAGSGVQVTTFTF